MADDAVKVVIRVRPLNQREYSSGQADAWEVRTNSIQQVGKLGAINSVFGKKEEKEQPKTFKKAGPSESNMPKFRFDRIFSIGENNQTVYDEIAKSLVEKTISGINATIFAYGQTSSGKTHTIRGYGEEPGIVPLAVRDIFDAVEETPHREFLIRVSYLEIYNETINDLLEPSNTNLKLHEDKEMGPYVGGLREDCVVCFDQVEDLLNAGDRSRHVGSTNMNEKSSRSHSIFRMVVESRDAVSAEMAESGGGGGYRVACLNLVDLAGSERSKLTGAQGDRLKEGSHINKSLLTLGTVISKLTEKGGRGGHIPYRDSKLTRLLQNALGGNSVTTIICTITPSSLHIEETSSTLRFAERAKKVTNSAKVNETYDDSALMAQYQKEIEKLKEMLASAEKSKGVSDDSKEKDEMIQKLLAEKNEMANKVGKMTSMIIKSSVPLAENTEKPTRDRAVSAGHALMAARKQSLQTATAPTGRARAGTEFARPPTSGIRHSFAEKLYRVRPDLAAAAKLGEKTNAELVALLKEKDEKIRELEENMENEIQRRVLAELAETHAATGTEELERERLLHQEEVRELNKKISALKVSNKERKAVAFQTGASHSKGAPSSPAASAASPSQAPGPQDSMLVERAYELEEELDVLEETVQQMQAQEKGRRQSLHQFKAAFDGAQRLRYLDLATVPKLNQSELLEKIKMLGFEVEALQDQLKEKTSAVKELEHRIDLMQTAMLENTTTGGDSSLASKTDEEKMVHIEEQLKRIEKEKEVLAEQASKTEETSQRLEHLERYVEEDMKRVINDMKKEYTEGMIATERPAWIPDAQVLACHLCQRSFGRLVRRHHCRHCGKVLCAKCTAQKCPIPSLGYEQAVRVCYSCYFLLSHTSLLPSSMSTSATHTYAKGAGLEDGQASRTRMRDVKIYSHDEDNNKRTVGGDTFKVVYRHESDKGAFDKERPVVDLGNGIYTTNYLAPKAGEYTISITLNGNHISGSPYSINMTEPMPGRHAGSIGSTVAPGGRKDSQEL